MSVLTQIDGRIKDMCMMLVWNLYGPLHPYRFRQALVEYIDKYIDTIGNVYQPIIPHHYYIAISQSIYHKRKGHLAELSYHLQNAMIHWIRLREYRMFAEMIKIEFIPHTSIRKNEFIIQHAGITENDVATQIIPRNWFVEITGQSVKREKRLLETGNTFIFGRSKSCEMQFHIPQMSRRHFSVTVSATNEVMLRIFENKNNTVLNGLLLPKGTAVPVRSGDVVSIGKKQLVTVQFIQGEHHSIHGECK